MSYYYEEPDDHLDTTEPVIVDRQCWWCRKTFYVPEEDRDRCCSDECDLAWCRKSQEDIDAAMESFPLRGCAWCGQTMPTFRVDHVCESCRRAQAEGWGDDDEERVERTDEGE